ncbi:DUF1194 domain-containing protein [Methyloraptor flagellatus]|uniref:DUF1194 domain-containing protein n=1 Tax=Methyloraptor flagellatus TaxID=3162530 RepID=A0AAU7XBK4_9HYPH
MRGWRAARLAVPLALSLAGMAAMGSVDHACAADTGPGVDTALVLSVDVSDSVDETRFRLQMQGIAEALEDPSVERAILAGPRGAILLMLVEWADKPSVAVPWMRIGSIEDARRAAARIRNTPRRTGDFTCVAQMFRFVTDKVVATLTVPADRLVVDVSGDGRENCNPAVPTPAARDALVASGAQINGLPILEGDEAATLKAWYEKNVMGGEGAFVLPALGFQDFGRAFRQKFITEISMR